jgi:hypothetical protein
MSLDEPVAWKKDDGTQTEDQKLRVGIQCQWHKHCPESGIAKVGLPYGTAMWVCEEGFKEFRDGGKPAT